jgi:Rrf2 family protein
MFQLTRAGEYAIRAVIFLAMRPPDQVTGIREIAEYQNIPPSFLAKILQALQRRGIVRSHRGVRGGFTLARPAEEITLLEIIEIMEGPIFLNKCLIRMGECPKDETCSVHEVWGEAQARLLDLLGKCHFARLAARGMELEEKR